MTEFLKKWGWIGISCIIGFGGAVFIARCGSNANRTYVQIERLARPAINEALVRTNASHQAFNSIAPSIDLTTAAASVVAEAAVTLKALYAGACFVNGALTAAGSAVQLTPAGLTCQATGASILNTNLIGLNSAFDTAAGTYATRVAGQFLPDVMRINTAITSGYNAELCNAAAAGSPLLCGGRLLDDPVGDITYAYLLNGEASPSVASSIRNGAYYSPTVTDSTCTAVGGASNKCNNAVAYTNSRQGHKDANYATMPWGPAPY